MDGVRRRSSRIQTLEKEAAHKAEVSKRKKTEDDSSKATTKRPKKSRCDGSPKSDPAPQVSAASGGADQNADTNEIEQHHSVKVIETMKLFNKYYLHLVQEEDIRSEKAKQAADKKAKKSKQKNNDVEEEEIKRPSQRPDLKVVTKMIQNKELLSSTRTLGAIPGIDVGHKFFSRCEMVVLGFHCHWLNGIDYIAKSKQKEYKGYTLPIATSIVLSGQYEDDQDNYNDVVYTGQGGHDLLGKKRQIQDQKMERGNLAMKNCAEQSVAVRVIRGTKCRDSYVGKVYTYDGLYKVVNYWEEKGISGFNVFKFRLKRLEGQAPLTSDQVHFVGGRTAKSSSDTEGARFFCDDISGGLEDIPIPAINRVDDERISAPGFTYIKSLKWPEDIAVPTSAPGCNCEGACFDTKTCACAKLNGSDFPYANKHGGRLIEPKAVVFECGPNCGCGHECINRISQKGLRFRLEVFRTPNKGWGVRSKDHIPSGAPICEYIGRLMKTDQVDPSADTNYVFDIDCLQTMQGLDGRERRLRDVSLPDYVDNGDEQGSDNGPEFCIDGLMCGNVSRFINHSCQPNLFVQCVLSDHHDIRLARVVLMAAVNIPAHQELTYDYGYALDSVMGADGKVKILPCYCGAAQCRKRLY